jgi:hypothetical protein
MISDRFDITAFSKHAMKQDSRGLACLADREAIEAERLLYRRRHPKTGFDDRQCGNYVQSLKALMEFIKYGFMSGGTDKTVAQVFVEICRGISENGRSRGRCMDEPAMVCIKPGSQAARSGFSEKDFLH